MANGEPAPGAPSAEARAEPQDDAPDSEGGQREAVAFGPARTRRRGPKSRSLFADQARLLEIFSLSPALMAVLQGPQHVFTYANPAYLRLVGHRDIIGKSARVALPEVEGQGYFEMLDRVYETGEPVSGIEALLRVDVRGDGRLEDRYFNFVYQPTRRPNGVTDGILVQAIEVTAQVEARRRLEVLAEERRLLALLVEHSREFIGVASPDGAACYVNPAGRALLGLESEEEVRRTSLLAYFPQEEQERISREIMPALLRDGQWDGEVQLQHCRTGMSIPVLWNAFTINDPQSGELTALACVARDVRGRKRAEEELRYRSQLTRTITESAASALFMLDANGYPTYLNPAAERMTGYVLAEIKDLPLHEAIHHHRPDGRPYPMAECPIEIAAEALVAIHDHEDVFVRKDGTFFPVVCTVVPLERNGARLGAVLDVRDVTEQKRAEAERARLLEREQAALAELETVHGVGQVLSAELDPAKLVQAVADATTMLTDAQFGAFFLHVADERGADYRPSAFSGAAQADLERLALPRITAQLKSRLGVGSVMRWDDVPTNPPADQAQPADGPTAGHPPAAGYLAVPVVSRSGEVIGVLVFGHAEPGKFGERHANIVRGIAAQTAIAMDNARLYQEARDAIRARDEFLSIAAHELRTPVTSIKGSAQLLARLQARGQLDQARLDRFLRAMVESSSRLAKLTDDLLDISRLCRGRLPLHLETTDLAELVRHVAGEAADRYEGRDVVVEAAACPCPSVVDPGRLAQVLTNLIDNAVKYSPNGAPVRVTLQVDGEGSRISVQDEGIGLPPDALQRIFGPFDRASNATRRELPGMGLGLYISQQIVEMHGGRIWAESAGEDRGATFSLWLPRRPEAGMAGPDR